MVFVKHQKQKISGNTYEYWYLYESYYNPDMEYPQNFKVGKVGDSISSLVDSLKDKADSKDIDLDEEDIQHFRLQVETVESKAEEEGVDTEDEEELGKFFEKAFSGEMQEEDEEEDDDSQSSDQSRKYDIGHRFIVDDTYIDVINWRERDGEFYYDVKEYDASGKGFDLKNEKQMSQSELERIEEDADSSKQIGGLKFADELIPEEVNGFEHEEPKGLSGGHQWVNREAGQMVRLKYITGNSNTVEDDRIRISHVKDLDDTVNSKDEVKTFDGADKLKALDKTIEYIKSLEVADTVEDIAEILGIEENTVWSKKARCRDKIEKAEDTIFVSDLFT